MALATCSSGGFLPSLWAIAAGVLASFQPFVALAANAPTTNGEAGAVLVEVRVSMGHKMSTIRVARSTAGKDSPYDVRLRTTDGIDRTSGLSKANYEHLRQKISEAGASLIEPGECAEGEVRVDDYDARPPIGWRVCIPSESKAANRVNDIVKTLMLLF